MNSSLQLLNFNDEKRKLIKNTVARGLNDLQFEYFINVASARGLDPTLNQIHAVIRGGKLTIQVAIDGLRLVADRTGCYAGQDEPVFEYESGSKHPDACKVTVYKIVQGSKVSFTGRAKWSEYYPGEKMGHMWKKMPETMLAKCAEAQALRRAFPNDMSGLFVREEMQNHIERTVGSSDDSQRLLERFAAEDSIEPPEFVEIDTVEGESEGV